MLILQTKPYLTDSELKQRWLSQKNPRLYQDWQIIYSVQKNPGKKADEFASMLGISKSKIYSVIEAYNKYGPNWKEGKHWGGRREERAYLSLEEEKRLLDKISLMAIEGKIFTINDIRDHIEAHVGKKVSDDYIWDLFNRHGWGKKAPRPKHPENNPQQQEEFKKNLKKVWMPPF